MVKDNYKTYLGIDFGLAKIGLALADSETKLATPYKVVHSIGEVASIIKEENVDAIVIGMPLSKQNDQTVITEKVDDFILTLKKDTAVEIFTIDERFTTKMADKLLRGEKRKADEDAVSAMLILQTYLDKNTKETNIQTK